MAPKPAQPVIGYDDDIVPGTVIAGFKGVLPVADDVCHRHAAANRLRGLAEAIGPRRHLTVIANGPSARDIDLTSIGPTIAVNGSIGLFVKQGVAPTFWAGCDPQAILADWLPENPPKDTIYFVASKCHPSVFEKLRGCDVRVWHLQDHPAPGQSHVPLCSTITLCAAWLMFRLGFTDFDFYGWDGCFMDGRHHAHGDADWGDPELYLNYGGEIKGAEVIGGRTFPTTRSWALEAEGAQQFFQLAKYFDIGVVLHGDGMFRCAKEFSEQKSQETPP